MKRESGFSNSNGLASPYTKQQCIKEHITRRNWNLSNVLKELAGRLSDRVVHRLLRSLDPHLEQPGESERENVKLKLSGKFGFVCTG